MKITLVTGLVLVLLLSLISLGATRNSDVADAAMRGDDAAVKTLIEHRGDVNAKQADGATAIHWAAYRDDSIMADMLIAAGANVKVANREGATPLSLAAINGSAVMLQKLLNAGADVNEHLPNGETPLMFVSRNGNLDAIKLLLDHGADVNAKENLRGTTPIMWAVEQMHPAAVKLLIDRGADVNAQSKPSTHARTAYLAPTATARAEQVVQQTSRGGLRGARGGQPGAPAAARGGARGVPADVDVTDFFIPRENTDGGGLIPLVFAAREGDLESTKLLLAGGAKVNQTTRYGWTALLTATQNRHYELGAYLLDHGADPNVANKGGWTPLYLATDNRNIEGGDYPVPKADMDHLEFINKLLEHRANVNARAIDSTETRTIFTMQWLYEDGATPLLRAAQSGDVILMKLLLEHGADPKIPTKNGDTALMVAAGIGWVEGVTSEWGEKENLEAVKMCLDLGIDVNAVDGDGRTALHGAAHKGRNAVVQLLVDHGAKLDAKDAGSRDTLAGAASGVRWMALDYAEGLVRVGVQSAIPHPETAALIRKLMKEHGLEVPPENRNPKSICVTAVCKGQ
jgi:ankyrin repeat protein